MDFVLLYNKSSKFGLLRDVEGIFDAVGTSFHTADPLEPPIACGTAIHLEVPVYAWMPWATTNIFVVNPEWFEPAWVPYMPRFKYVVYKDHFSAGEAVAAGYVKQEQVRVIPWGAAEPVTTEKRGTVNTGFVWFLGGSVNKRAYVSKLLPLWREEYPPLRIYTTQPLDLSGVDLSGRNVRVEVRDLSPVERTGLAHFFRGHVACSKAEGFSYAAAEAEWHGAFTLLNGLNCYRADYESEEGAYIFNETQADLDAAIKAFEATDFPTLEAKRSARAAKRYQDFKRKVAELFVPSKPAGPFPPILVPSECPPISIVTLMYNRRRFFDLACHNILQSDYPLNKIEWIIVEDSDDPMEDASDLITATANKSNSVKIVYVPIKKKTIAEKRNLGVLKATADIVLMMDDDDHYPVTSFRRRVAWLLLHPWKPKAVTGTTIACYDLVKGISAVNVPPMQLPLGQRISEATLAFYKSWWEERGFPGGVQVGEGEDFITGREMDVLEVPPQQIIVAFSHGKNTSSRRIPDGDVKPGCFWGFPKDFLVFVHGLAGINVVE